jgi:hypothetical protein
MQHGGKKVLPVTIATRTAESSIKSVARDKHPSLYGRIKDEDLIAKEFRYHSHCYRNFTRGEIAYDKKGTYETGDFDAVSEFITTEVIERGRVVSLNEIHSLYGLQVDKKRYANLLKQRINTKFKEGIIILSPQNCSGPEYIASKDINKDSLHHRQDTIQAAASYLREDITTHADNLQEIIWPPTIEQLSTEERKPPESVRKFFESILSQPGHCDNVNAPRLVDSFSQDLVHGVTKGKTIMEKHFLVGLGVHNLTGQRNVVEILNKFGHSVSYTMTSEILTANAKSCLEKSRLSLLLPLHPSSAGKIVLSHFWVDNFDLATDKQYGGGEINITTLMAFQEGRTLEDHVHVPRKASCKIRNEDPALYQKTFTIKSNHQHAAWKSSQSNLFLMTKSS